MIHDIHYDYHESGALKAVSMMGGNINRLVPIGTNDQFRCRCGCKQDQHEKGTGPCHGCYAPGGGGACFKFRLALERNPKS